MSRVDVTAAPGEKPSVGAQKGGSPDDGSQKKTLAIIIPLALIGTIFFGNVIKLVNGCIKMFGEGTNIKLQNPTPGSPNAQASIDVIKLVTNLNIENSTLFSVEKHLRTQAPSW